MTRLSASNAGVSSPISAYLTMRVSPDTYIPRYIILADKLPSTRARLLVTARSAFQYSTGRMGRKRWKFLPNNSTTRFNSYTMIGVNSAARRHWRAQSARRGTLVKPGEKRTPFATRSTRQSRHDPAEIAPLHSPNLSALTRLSNYATCTSRFKGISRLDDCFHDW